MAQQALEFWYEFASPYSYLSAVRIEKEAKKFDVAVQWKPFLLGPIFHNSGYEDSPFNAQPIKRDYMWRDVQRCCQIQGLNFVRPDPFPGNGLKAARLALLGMDQGWGADFSVAVYKSYFGQGDALDDEDHLKTLLSHITPNNPDDLWDLAQSSQNKSRLREQTQHAADLGIFGAPTFIRGNALFWGNDRLEMALSFKP